MKRIEIYENGINIVFEITDENEAKLLHFSALPFDEAKTASYMGQQIYRDRSGLENEVQGLP